MVISVWLISNSKLLVVLLCINFGRQVHIVHLFSYVLHQCWSNDYCTLLLIYFHLCKLCSSTLLACRVVYVLFWLVANGLFGLACLSLSINIVLWDYLEELMKTSYNNFHNLWDYLWEFYTYFAFNEGVLNEEFCFICY